MKSIERCLKGNHTLVTVYTVGEENCIQSVIKWCKVCGGITVDSKFNGKVRPGAVMPMKLPKYTNEFILRK